MATQQGHATDQGRRRQQRQQVTRHNRAEHNAQPANGQEDEGAQRETYDEDADGLVRGPLMWPIAAQPLFYIPSLNAPVYHSMLPRYDPYVPAVQDHGGLAAPEYIRLVESSTLYNLFGNQGRGEGPQRGTGEPHERTRDNPMQHAVDFEEGHGDVQQSTAAEEPIQHEQHYGQIATLGTMFIRGMVSGSATPFTPQ